MLTFWSSWPQWFWAIDSSKSSIPQDWIKAEWYVLFAAVWSCHWWWYLHSCSQNWPLEESIYFSLWLSFELLLNYSWLFSIEFYNRCQFYAFLVISMLLLPSFIVCISWSDLQFRSPLWIKEPFLLLFWPCSLFYLFDSHTSFCFWCGKSLLSFLTLLGACFTHR